MKRDFLMQARKLDLERLQLGDWFWSTKLDGIRGLWDGGITRGKPVPWDPTRTATGLWSRYMNPIYALPAWLDKLPAHPLDGEMWAGPGNFNFVSSVVRRHIPDQRWRQIGFHCYDMPTLDQVFELGLVKNQHCNVLIDANIREQLQEYAETAGVVWETEQRPFLVTKQLLEDHAGASNQIVWVPTPQREVHDYEQILNEQFPILLDAGHEGIVFRKARMSWCNERSWNIMKVKPYKDAEATVVGYTAGKNRHEGRVGALSVDFNGIKFDIGTGLTDADRDNPPAIGSVITFKYRELTPEGVPREARYYRVRG